jgi:hypothetical protein
MSDISTVFEIISIVESNENPTLSSPPPLLLLCAAKCMEMHATKGSIGSDETSMDTRSKAKNLLKSGNERRLAAYKIAWWVLKLGANEISSYRRQLCTKFWLFDRVSNVMSNSIPNFSRMGLKKRKVLPSEEYQRISDEVGSLIKKTTTEELKEIHKFLHEQMSITNREKDVISSIQNAFAGTFGNKTNYVLEL